ncbi:GNAT family N-acetyltransferase [Corynebacterium glyciniphilum]|uniref:GNAT family N-acetyltransferase n=1 Tax=Corynebacterium glyciniphilum TaxID=1404244 RepID=UPI0011AB3337|nr:GNAT family N-acetyltransferase [Corynebacterium glyciniphilum]
MTFTIRPMREDDYAQVARIQQSGMDTGHATYEGETLSWDAFMEHKIADLMFVADEDGDVLGWVSASRASRRSVFDGVLEDSVYIAPDAAGRGVAGALLDHMIAAATEAGYWAMHSTVFPENQGSLKLHLSRGFTEIGVAHTMARMNYGPMEGRWRDILLLEKILEGGPAYPEYRARVGE